MIPIFIFVFVLVVLFNWYTILFGKKDLEQLKNKISIQKYLKEMNEALSTGIGEKEASLVKLVAIVLCVVIVICNAYAFLAVLVALIVGTFAAKKSYQVGAVSNLLNKMATYINRVR